MAELPLDGQGSSWDSSCHPRAAAGWEGSSCSTSGTSGSPPELLLRLQAAKTRGKVLQKILFCPWFGFSALSWPRSFGVSLLRVWMLLLGLRGGFWPGWAGERLPKPLEPPELLPAFKTSGFARSSSTGAFPLPFPRLPSVSAGFLVQPLVQFRVTSGCF